MVDNPDIPESEEERLQPKEEPEQVRQPQEQAPEEDLLAGYSPETLLDTKDHAAWHVKSDDDELGMKKVGFLEEEIDILPTHLKSLPEGQVIFDLLTKPLTNKTQIKQRQALIKSLLESGNLENIHSLKNEVYLITTGIRKLFTPIRLSDYGSTVPIDAYRDKSEMDEVSHIVHEGLDQIETGSHNLEKLTSILGAATSPFMTAFAPKFQEMLEQSKIFTREYFLEKKYSRTDSMRFAGNCQNTNLKLGVFVEWAHLSQKDGYGQGTYNQNQPYEHKGGWNLYRAKKGEIIRNRHRQQVSEHKEQIPNDSPKDRPTTLLVGSNMSGKSYLMKSIFWIQASAQTFGYGPFEEGNFDIYNSFHYLDRASTDARINLSAFGKEVEDWKEAIAQFKEKPFVCCDEGWSTTSPDGQYILLTAVDLYLRKKGAKAFFATHNENFIKRHEGQDVGLYHLVTNVEEGGKITHTHQLTEGIDDSKALEIGKSLELPQELIDLATQYLAGETPTITGMPPQKSPKVEWNTEAEREALKKESLNPNDVINYTQDVNNQWRTDNSPTLLNILSTDRDFKPGFMRREGALIHAFLFKAPPLSAKEITERQRTFEALANSEELDKYKDLEKRLLLALRFLPGLFRGRSTALFEFNTALNPFDRGQGASLKTMELFMAFFRLNQKVLGNKFPWDDDLEKIKLLEKVRDTIEIPRTRASLEEIIEMQNKDLDGPIEDPEIITAFHKLVDEYKEPDQEEKERIKAAPLTRRKIQEYSAEHRRYDSFSLHDNDSYKKIYYETLENYPHYGESLSKDKKRIQKDFRQLIQAIGEDEPEKWKGKICLARLNALFKRIDEKQEEIEDYSNLRNKLYKIYKMFLEALKNLNFGTRDKRITPTQVENTINNKMQILLEKYHKQKEALGVSIFDINLENIKEELAYLSRHAKKTIDKTSHEYDHDNQLPKNLRLALSLEMLLDPENRIQQYIATLREADSVHCHQMANHIEEALLLELSPGESDHYSRRDWWEDEPEEKFLKREWERNKEKWIKVIGAEKVQEIDEAIEQNKFDLYSEIRKKHGFATGSSAMETLRIIYNNTSRTIVEDFQQIDERQKALIAKYPALFGTSEFKDWMCALVKVVEEYERTNGRGIGDLKEAGRWKADKHSESSPSSNARELVQFYISFLQNDSWHPKNEEEHPYYKKYSVKMHRVQDERILENTIKEFIGNELIGSRKFEELRAIVHEFKAIGKAAEAFVTKHRIEFKRESSGWGSSRERDENAHKKTAAGDLYYLKKHVLETLGKEMYDIFGFGSHDDDGTPLQIAKISTFFHIAQMIRDQKQIRVEFNEEGRIEIEQATNTLERTENQVRNDITYDVDELLRVLASPNMSGKTYSLKTFFGMIGWGLATGHAPATKAVLPIFDKLIYMDRVITKSDKNLSAYGQEVEFWKQVDEIMKGSEEKSVFIAAALDEIFSTTSPDYQAALTYAVATQFFMRLGNKGMIACHNHEAVKRLLKDFPDKIKPYHFGWKVEKDKEGRKMFVPTYKLKPGNVESNPIEIARWLGLEEEILEIAELIRDTAAVA